MHCRPRAGECARAHRKCVECVWRCVTRATVATASVCLLGTDYGVCVCMYEWWRARFVWGRRGGVDSLAKGHVCARNDSTDRR